MDPKSLERMLRPGASRSRPLILRAIAGYAIDPPERFCGIDIILSINSTGQHVASSNVYGEFRRLLAQQMLEHYQTYEPYDRAVWYARIDQPAWDVALDLMNRTERTDSQ